MNEKTVSPNVKSIRVDGLCAIEGTNFRGLEAVRKNRQITEAYKGVLTDEKVRDIVRKYGLPKKVERDYSGFCDENYLNAFGTYYLSDGYLYDWDNYRIPTRIYFGAVVLDLVMCAAVFGLDGLSCPLGITMNQQLSLDRNVPHPEACMQTGSFIGILLIVSLLAVLVLCAVTLCVLAHFHSCFHAVMVSSACWGMPVMIRIFFGRFAYALMAGTPVFLIFYNNTLELLRFQILRVISLTFAITLLVVGTVCGYRGYKRNRFIF